MAKTIEVRDYTYNALLMAQSLMAADGEQLDLEDVVDRAADILLDVLEAELDWDATMARKSGLMS